ncbi:sodium/hydrogen exchanger 9B2-like isoform X1 [Styela clava]
MDDPKSSCPENCLVKNVLKPGPDAPVCQKIKYAFVCPPHGTVERFSTNVLLLLLSWAVPWSILGDDCLPGTNIFGLIAVIDACVVGGFLVSIIQIPHLPPLPPLLGMLIAGFCLRNIPGINVAKYIDPNWSSALRSIALSIILVKAGLELDASALKKMKGACIRLTALPCLIETATCAITCRFILGFPWEWGFMLGFVLAAVTPAVIVPSLLSLQEQGYGTDQGIPTLVIAASSFDDVLAISGFSVVLGIAFSQASTSPNTESISLNETIIASTLASAPLTTDMISKMEATSIPVTNGQEAGDLVWTILRGPVEMIVGIVVGILIGLILWFLPAKNNTHTVRDRVLLVISFGIFVLFGSRQVKFPGAGALAAIVLSFVAAISWKSDKEKVSEYVGILWDMFEPVMFGLIGAEISIEALDSSTVGLGLAVLFIGLLTRTVGSFTAVSAAGFTLKEKVFICLSWLPKATVQAAIGPVALDTARKLSVSSEIEEYARQVLTIAVLSILITAPLGAAAIGLSGPKLLQKAVASSDSAEEDSLKVSSLRGPRRHSLKHEENESIPLTEIQTDN